MLLKVIMDIFQQVGKDIGPFGEKKKFFWKIFFPKPPKPRMRPKGTTAAFGTSLCKAPRTNVFFQSLSFTPKSCGVLLKVVMDIFQEVGKDKGPFGEKKNFCKIFSQSLQNRGCVERGPLKLLALPFGQHRGQIFFPKSFFYTLVMWRALKSGYGHFPRGREGYRTIWRKKKFFGNFFPKGDHCSFWHFPLDSTEDKFFFQSLSFTPKSCGVLLKVVMDIFQEVEKDKGPFREKKNFGKFFPKVSKTEDVSKGDH